MTTRMNNEEGLDKRSPEELAAEIDQTRSAIAGDIRELGDKLSPDNLKAGARGIVHEATEEAKDALRGVKDAAVDRMRTAKDHAMESVSETAYEVSERARRAGVATAGFVTANAVPLTLIGIGAGWLMMTMRRQRRMREDSRPYGMNYTWREDSELGRAGWYEGPSSYESRSFGPESSHLMERSRGRVGQLAERAKESGQHMRERVVEGSQHMRERVQEGGEHMRQRVQETMSDIGSRANALAHDARDGLVRAGHGTREFAYDNPLAVGALAVAAGVGIGLALPTSRMEDRLLGPTRGRLTDQARGLVDEARSTAQHAAQAAREAAGELKSAISQPSASSSQPSSQPLTSR
jgi:ElaB/YqjD/DUF883 family membrane-anchored ribosome-binding protein